jgi:8-oxo-dGTP pyrophosphatase MutT (NUDIX family)
MPREKSAGAIIYRKEDGKIYYLLLHYPGINRKGGHWEFAKGHIEEGEDYFKTVKREVAEETGLKDIRIIPGFKEHIKYFFKQKKVSGDKKTAWIFKLVTFFVAETKTKEIKLSPEHIGFVWLPYEEALKKITYKNSKDLFKRVNEFIISKKSLQRSKEDSQRKNSDL